MKQTNKNTYILVTYPHISTIGETEDSQPNIAKEADYKALSQADNDEAVGYAFQDISRCFKTFQNVSRHFKTFKTFQDV